MANEPERPIETLLRAAAKKRRDEAGVPFELHPADRRLLQGEVARKFARPQPEPRSLAVRLGQLWPRFAWGLGILAVLGLSVWLLLPPPGRAKPEALLARKEPAPEALPANEPAPAPATAPAAIAPPPGLPAKTKSAELASAETPAPAPVDQARQFGAVPPLLAKNTTVARDESPARNKLELAAPAQLADQEKKTQMQLAAPSGTPAPAPAGAVNGAFAARYGLAAQPSPPAAVPASPAMPPAVAAAAPAASVALAEESAKPADDRAGQVALQYKSPATVAFANRLAPATAATDSLAGSAADASKGANAFANTQRFVQAAPAPDAQALFADKAMPAKAVLASFQVEQTGSQLRIVDGDGSVYSGYVQPVGAALRARSAKLEAPAAAATTRAPGGALAPTTSSSLTSDQPASQNYAFRVAGTNRSLNQKVVFTGNLLTATNLASSLPAVTNQSVGGGLGGSQNAPAQQGLLPLLNSQISGKVVIGTGKAVEINALPANP
jgi:hypothetical protein